MQNQLIVRNPRPPFGPSYQGEGGDDGFMQIPSSNFELRAYHVPAPFGFHFPKGFPYCCPYHSDQFTRALQVYENFPDCCDGHRRLSKAGWFRKLDYVYVPFKIVSLVSYLHDTICHFRFHLNWRQVIADYIEYSVRSFGQFPDGYGSPVGLSMYISACTSMIEELDILRPEQCEALLKCLRPERTELNEPTDLSLLYKIYKDWMALFPFDLPMFRYLKEQFQHELPLIKGVGKTNQYSGLTCIQLRTRQELKDLLIGTTRVLLKEINSAKLYEEGILLHPDRTRIEMAIHQRKIRLEEDALTPVTEKTDFIRLLDKWLSDEKEFLKDIEEDVLKNSPLQFTSAILDGMKALQDNGVNEFCIRNVREDGPEKESQIRYWFRNWLRGRIPEAVVPVEEQQGDGYIDLRVIRKGSPDRVIEFKGWWNSDKNQASEQVCRYLTDFESEGFVFMINHLKRKAIDDSYKTFVTSEKMNYIPNSWVTYQRAKDLYFYASRHRFDGKEKTVFHFIFNIYY